MSDLITTNIRIPEEDFYKYKELAKKQGKSFAHLVRSALNITYNNLGKKTKKKKSLWDIGKYAISIKNYNKNETIDEVVYSHPHGYNK